VSVSSAPVASDAGPGRGYVPALDGMRAVSIALVLASHLFIYGTHPGGVMAVATAAGSAGVTVFFVISGYLITTLLLAEERETGRISLRDFYARRALRIFPAYYACLAVLAALTFVQWLPATPAHDFWASALYVRNFVGRGHETAHFWSLAVEEHFYLLWPSLFLLAPPRRRLALALGLVGAVCAWRTALVLTGNVGVGALNVRTDLRVDSIVIGCALALLLARRPDAHRPLFARAGRLAALATVALALWAVGYPFVPYAHAVGSTVSALLIAVVLHYVVTAPAGETSRVLSIAPLRTTGRLSYSLYLWQQVFMGPAWVAFGVATVRWFPLNLALTVAAAVASYTLIERPFLRLKTRFSPRAQARPHAAATVKRAMDPAGAAP
jgi:peptidoglycan/LPS O-acetylase OafA/YrhL